MSILILASRTHAIKEDTVRSPTHLVCRSADCRENLIPDEMINPQIVIKAEGRNAQEPQPSLVAKVVSTCALVHVNVFSLFSYIVPFALYMMLFNWSCANNTMLILSCESLLASHQSFSLYLLGTLVVFATTLPKMAQSRPKSPKKPQCGSGATFPVRDCLITSLRKTSGS